MSRIADGFAKAKAEGRAALIAYVTVGYPEAGATEALAVAILDGGADMIEIGVPFSDPLAEGTTIQRFQPDRPRTWGNARYLHRDVRRAPEALPRCPAYAHGLL